MRNSSTESTLMTLRRKLKINVGKHPLEKKFRCCGRFCGRRRLRIAYFLPNEVEEMAGSKTMSKRVKTVSKASAGGGDRLFSRRQERNDYSDSASESSEPEKDEIEQDLEKLIFGDQQGFLDALKQKSSSKGKELVLGQGGIGVDGELSQDEDLEDVADENVRPDTAQTALSLTMRFSVIFSRFRTRRYTFRYQCISSNSCERQW